MEEKNDKDYFVISEMYFSNGFEYFLNWEHYFLTQFPSGKNLYVPYTYACYPAGSILEFPVHMYHCPIWHEISIPPWISNNFHYQVWDEIIYPFPNSTVVPWELNPGSIFDARSNEHLSCWIYLRWQQAFSSSFMKTGMAKMYMKSFLRADSRFAPSQ